MSSETKFCYFTVNVHFLFMNKTAYALLTFLFISVSAVAQLEWVSQLKPLVVEDSTEYMTLEESMHENHVNSVSLLYVDEEGNSGVAAYKNAEKFEGISIHTLYQAGSISKPVAAVGVMVLARKYNLDLDESINTYLKSWKITSDEFDAEQVTIRNLLSHTAGTTVHGFMGYRKAGKVPEILEILNGDGNSDEVKMFDSPDSTWKYSGGGYQILHLLVEDVSGLDFADFMQREVLDPIGMTYSTYELKFEGTCDDCAHAFKINGKAYKPNWYLYPESAAAGLWTNTVDLAMFLSHLRKVYNGEAGVLSKEEVEEVFTPVQNQYGLGFSIAERNGELYVGHSGKNIGFSNDMAINISTGALFVVMSDSDGAFNVIEDIKRSIPGNGTWSNRPQVVVDRKELSTDQLNNITGNYSSKGENRPTFKARIVLEENDLVLINRNSGYRQNIIPISDEEFVLEDGGNSIMIKEENGVMVMSFGEQLKFIRK